MRPSWAEISLDSIESNFKKVKKLVGENVEVLAVVKADAYGHGAVSVSNRLLKCGANMLGVATVEEALELRENGITSKIVLLGGIQLEEAETVIKYDLTPSCFLKQTFDQLSSLSRKNGKKVDCHLKIDTGMTRLGVQFDKVEELLSSIDLDSINIEGVFTHLACANERNDEFTKMQIDRFSSVLETLKKLDINCRYVHCSNSAAVQVYPEAHFNLVRPGIMIYGSGSVKIVDLKDVMKLKTKIIQIKEVEPGTSVSYEGTFLTDRRSTIAVLPIGYADGYSRKLSNKAKVSINGKLAPVVGRVCMDLTMVDITDIKNVKVGDEVILFGDDLVSVEDISNWADTITYEIMTLIGKRIPRIYN